MPERNPNRSKENREKILLVSVISLILLCILLLILLIQSLFDNKKSNEKPHVVIREEESLASSKPQPEASSAFSEAESGAERESSVSLSAEEEEREGGERLPGEGTSSEEAGSGPERSGDYLMAYSDQALIDRTAMDQVIDQYQAAMPAGASVPQMVLNEILARHGYAFKKASIKAYFMQKEWYRARTTYEHQMDRVMQGLNEIEKKNINFIVENYR